MHTHDRLLKLALAVEIVLVGVLGVTAAHIRGDEPRWTITTASPERGANVGSPPAGVGQEVPPAAPDPAAPPAPVGSAYEFFAVDPDGPVRHDPCVPLHYVINEDGAPPNGVEVVREAFRRMSEATGIEMVYDGPTDEVFDDRRDVYQPKRYGHRWAPVLVAWVERADIDIFDGRPSDVAALGGGHWIEEMSGRRTYVTGFISIDRDASAYFESGFEAVDRTSAGALVMHEIGHVVGLDHVEDTGELMQPAIPPGLTDLGPGTAEGLRLLGAAAGCRPSLSPRPVKLR